MRIGTTLATAAALLGCAAIAPAQALDFQIRVSFVNYTSSPAIAYFNYPSHQDVLDSNLSPSKPSQHLIPNLNDVSYPTGTYGMGVQVLGVGKCYMTILVKRAPEPVNVTCSVVSQEQDTASCTFAAMPASATECAASVVAK